MDTNKNDETGFRATPDIKGNQPASPLSEFEKEGYRRKGILCLVLSIVLQALLILCILLRGPVAVTIAIIGLAVVSLVCWFVAAVYLNSTDSKRLQRFAGYLLGAFILADILTLFLAPTLNARIITVKQDGTNFLWETHYAIKDYECQYSDGQTVNIPVKCGKVYVVNKTDVTLEASQANYIVSDLKQSHLNAILIEPDGVSMIHGRPYFMFRTPPSHYVSHNFGRNSELNGYYGVLNVAVPPLLTPNKTNTDNQ